MLRCQNTDWTGHVFRLEAVWKEAERPVFVALGVLVSCAAAACIQDNADIANRRSRRRCWMNSGFHYGIRGFPGLRENEMLPPWAVDELCLCLPPGLDATSSIDLCAEHTRHGRSSRRSPRLSQSHASECGRRSSLPQAVLAPRRAAAIPAAHSLSSCGSPCVSL